MSDSQHSELPQAIQNLRTELIEQAFAHRSLRAQSIPHYKTNERLEFLGDAVLELVVSEFLYREFPRHDEGTLTRYRAALVRTESLAKATEKLELQYHLHMNTGVDDLADEISESVMADLFEAVIGALYLNDGYTGAKAFIQEHLLTDIDESLLENSAKDPKTRLQELVQSEGDETPIYTIVHETGPDHAKVFTAAVNIGRNRSYTGTGASKQKAEQSAAENALLKLATQ